MNSNEGEIRDGGVEVYASPNSDLSLAKLLADNIVKTAKTKYSQLDSYKAEDGVYVRTTQVASIYRRTYKGIYDTIPYLFIIREIGGIATGAYVDGSNSSYGINEFRNSNVGVEGYLIELGYINVEEDLRNVLRNGDLYIEAITNTINDFYNIK